MRVDKIDNYINGWFIGDFNPALIQNKNFEIADQIREELLKEGIILEDTKSGTKWKKI